jgi:hypothetical protein
MAISFPEKVRLSHPTGAAAFVLVSPCGQFAFIAATG